MKILRDGNKEFRQLKSAKTGESYSRSAVLSFQLGSQELFISHEILEPGKASSVAHRHSDCEESVFVLKGELLAREGAREECLAAGDCCVFQPDTREKHQIHNRSSQVAEFLLIRKNS